MDQVKKKKKIGRPLGPETEKITFKLNKPLVIEMRKYCQEKGVVMQKFVEKALEQYILFKIHDKT